MRVLVFDPFRGAAGDMVCGALLQAGADAALVSRAMSSVVSEPAFETVDRSGIKAVRVDTRAPVVHRSLPEVLERVKGADAPAEAVAMACRVFERIARGEAAIHGASAHFHEVGADDAIADVTGACTALLTLAVDEVATGPVSLGGGTVRTSHGTYPVPAPATLAILREGGLRVQYGTADDGELCTPTGAALLSECATLPPGTLPAGRVVATGYGAGVRDSPGIPNVLRVTILETGSSSGEGEVDILETSVDDVTGEVVAGCMETLMALGARDVSAIPCTMKKGRPGHLIRVICLPRDSARLARELAIGSGTLGVRCLPGVHRIVAGRKIRTVTLHLGGRAWDIPVKCGFLDGQVFSVKAESARVHEVAAACSVPAREVARLAEEKARKTLNRTDA